MTLILSCQLGWGRVNLPSFLSKPLKNIISKSKVLGAFLKLLFLPNRFSVWSKKAKNSFGFMLVCTLKTPLKKELWFRYPKGGFCKIFEVCKILTLFWFIKYLKSVSNLFITLPSFPPTPTIASYLKLLSFFCLNGKKREVWNFKIFSYKFYITFAPFFVAITTSSILTPNLFGR